jgi:hypothetical protein
MSDTITPRLRIKAQPEIAVRAKPVPPPKVRLRVTPALLPMEIELRNTGALVQWRYLGQDWQDLIAIDDLDTTVTVGTVTTLPPGSPAAVVNIGTSKDMVLNFSIPAGIQGIQGNAATIAVGTVTTVGPATPAAVSNAGTANDAVFNFAIPQGAAATLAVGTVTTLTPGSAATVTNVGTSGAAVLNFGIPRGAPGIGDVNGPAGAANGSVAVFDGTSGKLIKDSGVTLGTAASTNTGTSAGNVPLLDGSGQLDTAVIPAIAITDVFVVASQAAMLALAAQKGDIAIRTDLNKSFALQTNIPTILADWKELLTPTDAVLSVAGLTGAIPAANLKTALAITQADVSGLTTTSSPQFTGIELGHATDTTLSRTGAGQIAVEGIPIPSISSTHTLTNKRLNPRVATIASSATPAVNTDSTDIVNITALATAITSMSSGLTGTATVGNVLIYQIKDDGTARAIAWGASFSAKGVALPTTTIANKLLTVGLMWNGSNWGCVGSAQEG